MVFNKRWRERDVSVTVLLNKLKWQSLRESRRAARLAMVYRIVNGLVAIPLDRFALPGRLTRHDHDKKLGCVNSSHEIPRQSFFRRVTKDWNDLSMKDAVNAPSLDSFRNRLSKLSVPD